MRHGFVTVAAAVPSVRVADTDFNLRAIECQIARAEGMGVEVLCFPELSLTGYTCQDLFRSQLLVDKAEEALLQLLDFTRKLDVISIVGLPVAVGGLLLNCAAVVQKGSLLGIVPKTYLPNYNEFYEKRWFASSRDLRPTEVYLAGSSVVLSPDPKVFVTVDGTRFGIEICEDVWAPVPPSNNLALAGADIVFNLSASNELIGKHAYLKSLLAQQSARTISGYVYAGSGFGESTQDVVYGGNALVYENGALLGEGDRFSLEPQLLVAQVDVDRLRSERRSNTTFVNASRTAGATVVQAKPVEARDFMLLRDVEPWPFVPQGSDSEAALNEVLDIQTLGLAQRLAHTKCCQVVVGISGGLDSTLALLVCVRAFDRLKIDRRGIVGVTMRHPRPHPRQCRGAHAVAGRVVARDKHQGQCGAAFHGHRPRHGRSRRDLREQPGARAHTDTDGPGQRTGRIRRRHSASSPLGGPHTTATTYLCTASTPGYRRRSYATS